MTTEAEKWLPTQPRNADGKIDIKYLIFEGQRRGYCICPKPMRQMINLEGMTCTLCGMKESRESWEFWYDEIVRSKREENGPQQSTHEDDNQASQPSSNRRRRKHRRS